MNIANWQPIETAPKDGTWILAVVYGFVPTVVIWNNGRWESNDQYHGIIRKNYKNNLTYEPTHWQPLPDGPA